MAMDKPAQKLLEVVDLHVSFETGQGTVEAVNGVSFDLNHGEVLVLIGESGSGKSVSALSIMGTVRMSAGTVTGQAKFKGRDMLQLSNSEIRRVRGNQIAMIPQDPMVSFDPVYTIGAQIVEAIQAHMPLSRQAARERAIALLKQVGIPSPELRASQFPHQFSGGMAQRALIAMALACEPEILIADEPTTALDVTVQAQILELLMELKATMGLAILFITHDMGVAAQIADRVAVMYAGRIVEQAEVHSLFYDPQHPYTWGLLQSLLRIDQEQDAKLKAIPGAPPSPVEMPTGCKFHPRCPYRKPVCSEVYPPLTDVSPGHLLACHLTPDERLYYRPE